MKWITLALCMAALQSSAALPQYRDNIPNGHSVPCPPGAFGCVFNICNGVGHNSCLGGGTLNAFGTAFAAANFMWTPALCAADSDGDGLSNGLELGDPCCVWTKGATPAQAAISHPGFASDGALHRTAAPRCTPPAVTGLSGPPAGNATEQPPASSPPPMAAPTPAPAPMPTPTPSPSLSPPPPAEMARTTAAAPPPASPPSPPAASGSGRAAGSIAAAGALAAAVAALM